MQTETLARLTERKIIAGILAQKINPVTLGLHASDFSVHDYAELVLVACRILEEKTTFDIATIHSRLAERAIRRDEFGAAFTIQDLQALYAEGNVTADFSQQVQTLRESKLKSELAYALQDALAESDNLSALDLFTRQKETVREFEEKFFSIQPQLYETQIEASEDTLAELTDAFNGVNNRIPTGFARMDKIFGGGLTKGELIVIAARPKTGKTAFSLQMAFQQAMHGIPSIYVSREVSKKELNKRHLCRLTAIPMWMMNAGISQYDYEKLCQANEWLKKLPLTYETRFSDIQDIEIAIEQAIKEKNVRVAYVDYLQLIKNAKRQKLSSKAEVVSETVHSLMDFARKFQIPIVLSSQFNRSGSQSGEPEMNQTAHSSDIENDCHVGAILAPDSAAELEKAVRAVSLKIKIARSLPPATFNFLFTGSSFLFEEI